MKKCYKCKLEKDDSEFYKNKYICIDCQKIQMREYRTKNADKLKEYAKEYNITNQEKIKIRAKKYRKNNQEKIQKQRQEYRDNNKEILNQKAKDYVMNNKEAVAKRKKLYRAKPENFHRSWVHDTTSGHKKRGFKILYSTAELLELAINTTHCPMCDCELSWGNKGRAKLTSPSLDRIDNTNDMHIGNVQILCRLCNTTKGPRTMDEFIEFCSKITLKLKRGK